MTGGRLNLRRTVTVIDTNPPAVSITSPAGGTTYTSAQTVTLRASASDDTGVAKVEFYDTGTLKVIGSSPTPGLSRPRATANIRFFPRPPRLRISPPLRNQDRQNQVSVFAVDALMA